jgi:hypothetical protein
MNKIRRYAYAALLAFTMFNFTPTPIWAQEIAHGRFTLAHDVHWQNAIVPAGDYHFSVETDGPSSVLTLSKVDGRRAGFLLVAHETDKDTDAGSGASSRLLVENTPLGSYVSAMQLPTFDITLHFTVPEQRQIARAAITARPSGQ